MSRIRITGGDWRSRRITVTDAPGLRPTPDRVRETLFNWLGQDLTGWHCLDLFAGSGILGFEAASRGALSVDLVDNHPHAFAHLRENARAFADPRLKLHRTDALEFAALAGRQGVRYDLIMLDPPYGHGWLARVAPLLPVLARPGMHIYVEAEQRIESLGDWRMLKQGQAGQVFYHLLEHT